MTDPNVPFEVGQRVVVVEPSSSFFLNAGTVVSLQRQNRGGYLSTVVKMDNQPAMLQKRVKFSDDEIMLLTLLTEEEKVQRSIQHYKVIYE